MEREPHPLSAKLYLVRSGPTPSHSLREQFLFAVCLNMPISLTLTHMHVCVSAHTHTPFHSMFPCSCLAISSCSKPHFQKKLCKLIISPPPTHFSFYSEVTCHFLIVKSLLIFLPLVLFLIIVAARIILLRCQFEHIITLLKKLSWLLTDLKIRSKLQEAAIFSLLSLLQP